MVQLIVFLPLFAALVAGLGNRLIGNFAAKLVTTAALFVSMLLSWPIFSFHGGNRAKRALTGIGLDQVRRPCR